MEEGMRPNVLRPKGRGAEGSASGTEAREEEEDVDGEMGLSLLVLAGGVFCW